VVLDHKCEERPFANYVILHNNKLPSIFSPTMDSKTKWAN